MWSPECGFIEPEAASSEGIMDWSDSRGVRGWGFGRSESAVPLLKIKKRLSKVCDVTQLSNLSGFVS